MSAATVAGMPTQYPLKPCNLSHAAVGIEAAALHEARLHGLGFSLHKTGRPANGARIFLEMTEHPLQCPGFGETVIIQPKKKLRPLDERPFHSLHDSACPIQLPIARLDHHAGKFRCDGRGGAVRRAVIHHDHCEVRRQSRRVQRAEASERHFPPVVNRNDDGSAHEANVPCILSARQWKLKTECGTRIRSADVWTIYAVKRA